MTKNDSLFAHGIKVFGNLLFLVTVLAVTLYVFECFDAKKIPYVLTEEDITNYSVLGIWAVGFLGLIWVFLMIMEVLKRRDFNLETLYEGMNNEPLPLWILKQTVVKIALAIMLLGSTLIFVPAGLMSMEDYWDGFKSYWVIIPAAVAAVWAIGIIGEVFKRKWRKFKTR